MPGNTERFEKAMSQGHSEAWDQNWERAAFYYRQALDEIPNHPKAITSLALALYELKAYSEALSYYQRSVELAPDDPLPLEKTSDCLEKTGKVNEAVQAYMRCAELYIKNRDVDKAISIWLHVLSLSPENLMAHSRLAIVFERLGQKPEAIREYLSIAALLQNAGQVAKAIQAVERALQITSDNPEAQEALSKIKAGQLLPRPALSKGLPLYQQVPYTDQLPEPREIPLGDGLDPIASARQKALSRLAGLVFDQMESDPESQAVGKGMQAIVKGKGLFGLGRSDQTKILLHLSQVVDLQARNENSQALKELEGALDAGLDEAAVYFDLGYLYAEANRMESSLRNLQKAVLHADYDLGSRLLMGQLYIKMGKLKEASNELLEALRIADMQTVPADQAEEIGQFYDPIIDEQGRLSDSEAASKLSNSIIELLFRENWQDNLVKARQQLQGTSNEVVSTPIIDMLVQARSGSGQLVESVNRVNLLIKSGKYRASMEEAFHALQFAPTYLPLHILIGDMLVQQNYMPEAAEKYKVIARCYGMRGETVRSISLYRKIVSLSPLDVEARKQLIDLLVANGQAEEVVQEYLRLVDVYFNLADLEMARQTSDQAFKVAQQTGVSRDLKVKVLKKIADIDLQSLDWKRALKAFEQIRNLKPDDEQVRTTIIDLNFRLGQEAGAAQEIGNYIAYLGEKQQMNLAVQYLENLAKESADQPVVIRQLGDVYRQMGRNAEALETFDRVGDLYMQQNNKAAAIEIILVILSLNPPNASDYQKILNELQSQ
jgi:tetratricopeptide (TPR) repeat protein